MPARRPIGQLVLALVLLTAGAAGATETKDGSVSLPVPELGDDGLHRQSWFQNTFLDLNEDLADAAAQGKRLVIIWEQRGCPYCKRTHEVNFRIPRIANYVKDNFFVLQLNLWGDREVTDFDGKTLSEKQLARKYKVLFTPTFQFFPETVEDVAGRPGGDAEVHRMPGYFWPFHFYFQFRYVKEKGYVEQPSFQRWLDGQGDKLRAAGVNVEEALQADSLYLPESF